MLCFDFTSLLGSDWARPCRKGERSWGEWKGLLELPANDQSEFFNQDLIWLILLWLIYSRALLEEYNLWLSTLGANSPTVTLGHRPLGREKTQGGRISSGCEVGFITLLVYFQWPICFAPQFVNITREQLECPVCLELVTNTFIKHANITFSQGIQVLLRTWHICTNGDIILLGCLSTLKDLMYTNADILLLRIFQCSKILNIFT